MDNIETSLIGALGYNMTEFPMEIKKSEITTQQPEINTTLSIIITPLTLSLKHIRLHHFTHPVTLSSEWSRLTRLIFLTILSVIGSIGNIFMISAVMVEDHLKKAGKIMCL